MISIDGRKGTIKANQIKAGSLAESNDRVINQLIVNNVLEEGPCELQMGLTELKTGSVWNTMPAHTHDRRVEAYYYFNVPEGNRICHLMGEPKENRLIWMNPEQAVISPESLTDIQRILEMQFVILAVHIHYAVATGIDHTKLAAFQKILRLEGIYCLKLDSLRHRHDTSENETVIHSVCEVNLIRLHHFFHQKTGTELLVVVMFHICGMTRVKNLIVGLSLHRATRRKHK